MGIQDKSTKNSIKSKNYPKSKTLSELEKTDIEKMKFTPVGEGGSGR